MPPRNPSSPPVTRHCRCGARIARDNREELCSPCQAAQFQRDLDRRVREAAERRARPRSVYAARKALTLADVPHTDEPDPLPQPEVRAIVLAYARTGDYDLTADEVGHQRVDVMRCLRRAAAMTMIDYMVEEGTWPN